MLQSSLIRERDATDDGVARAFACCGWTGRAVCARLVLRCAHLVVLRCAYAGARQDCTRHLRSVSHAYLTLLGPPFPLVQMGV
eukprot:1238869-Rhodomonas_salina.1